MGDRIRDNTSDARFPWLIENESRAVAGSQLNRRPNQAGWTGLSVREGCKTVPDYDAAVAVKNFCFVWSTA